MIQHNFIKNTINIALLAPFNSCGTRTTINEAKVPAYYGSAGSVSQFYEIKLSVVMVVDTIIWHGMLESIMKYSGELALCSSRIGMDFPNRNIVHVRRKHEKDGYRVYLF